MHYPIITVAIATFNSERTLTKTLESIRKQNFPKSKIEILIIDGGSRDKTLKIAKYFGCRIIKDYKISKIELVYAKQIAFFKAKGKYLMYLDSDEILKNPNSLKVKYLAFQTNCLVKSVLPSGYKSPSDGNFINNYINEFGDPFTFFIYHESKGDQFLINEFRRKYNKIYEDKSCLIFDFSKSQNLPLIELWAGGCMLDLQYTKSIFPEIRTNPGLVAHLFYLLNLKNNLIAVTKNDYTIHNSVESFNGYLKKIIIRIKNNVYKAEMGTSGFLDRQNFSSNRFKIKKYLFIPYSFSIIFPTIDATLLSFSRRQIAYLIHLPLSILTAFLILYYLAIRTLNVKPKFVELKNKTLVKS